MLHTSPLVTLFHFKTKSKFNNLNIVFSCFCYFLGFVCLFVVVVVVCFLRKVSLRSSDHPGSCSVDQAGLKLRDLSASAS